MLQRQVDASHHKDAPGDAPRPELDFRQAVECLSYRLGRKGDDEGEDYDGESGAQAVQGGKEDF